MPHCSGRDGASHLSTASSLHWDPFETFLWSIHSRNGTALTHASRMLRHLPRPAHYSNVAGERRNKEEGRRHRSDFLRRCFLPLLPLLLFQVLFPASTVVAFHHPTGIGRTATHRRRWGSERKMDWPTPTAVVPSPGAGPVPALALSRQTSDPPPNQTNTKPKGRVPTTCRRWSSSWIRLVGCFACDSNMVVHHPSILPSRVLVSFRLLFRSDCCSGIGTTRVHSTSTVVCECWRLLSERWGSAMGLFH